MFIQEDLEFARVGGQKRLMGAVSLGKVMKMSEV